MRGCRRPSSWTARWTTATWPGSGWTWIGCRGRCGPMASRIPGPCSTPRWTPRAASFASPRGARGHDAPPGQRLDLLHPLAHQRAGRGRGVRAYRGAGGPGPGSRRPPGPGPRGPGRGRLDGRPRGGGPGAGPMGAGPALAGPTHRARPAAADRRNPPGGGNAGPGPGPRRLEPSALGPGADPQPARAGPAAVAQLVLAPRPQPGKIKGDRRSPRPQQAAQVKPDPWTEPPPVLPPDEPPVVKNR